ncbi:hypothetical protein PQ465_14635 [Sphingobacterium oryzagri]|uniref:Bacterial surface antigen (D15) domain-containing protein n=1 Tax=Sphingobacterium oryzagri TaxID=3025669 RepID=A0ABY7WD01_9SPHI|nr:hypothetical protein [Sphingobacterium sp. KACC 22765]WDF67533.1 hypothetical protein PQ465_14635 [Sphingobacterium sp. KACC 22765]
MTVFLLFFSYSCFSQEDVVLNEKNADEQHFEVLLRKLGLLDTSFFDQSSASFRYGDGRQIVEMATRDGRVVGRLINHVYRDKGILFSTTSLTEKQLGSLDSLLKAYRVDTVPSGQKIAHWPIGFDGATYTFAFGCGGDVRISSYWEPGLVDLPEAKEIVAFTNALAIALDLDKQYTAFKDTWPREGCYLIGGMTTLCFAGNPVFLGFSGSTAYPLGYYMAKRFSLFSSHSHLLLQLSQRFNTDNETNYFQVNAIASKLFLIKDGLEDFLKIGFQHRRILLGSEMYTVRGASVAYGFSGKKMSIGIGGEYLKDDLKSRSGLNWYTNYFGLKIFDIDAQITFFKGQVNYELGAQKFVSWRSGWVSGIHIRLFTEQFYGAHQFGINLGVAL